MLHTNLLPEQEKKAIILDQWLRIITFFSSALSITLIIGITLLAPSYIPLYFLNRELNYSLFIQQETAKKIDQKSIVSDASNIKAVIVSLHQTTDIPSGALEIFDLLATTQSGIIVSGFTVDKDGRVGITGNATTRSNLLAFEQRLRDSSHFQDIASPLSNIIQETNINFNFKGTLKPNVAL